MCTTWYKTNVTSVRPRHLTPCVTLVYCIQVRNGLHHHLSHHQLCSSLNAKTSSKVTRSCHILVKRRKSPTDGRKESIAICDRLPGVECGRNLMKCFDAHLTSARSACLEQRHLGLIGDHCIKMGSMNYPVFP